MSLIAIYPTLTPPYAAFEPSAPHVWLGPSVVAQEGRFYVRDPQLYEEVRSMYFIDLIKRLLGATVEVAHEKTGVWSGHGHGRETITVRNPDGSLVYRLTHIGYCAGSGHSCSYNHGPWVEHGTYHGAATISPAATLRQAVRGFLAGSATTDDLAAALAAEQQ